MHKKVGGFIKTLFNSSTIGTLIQENVNGSKKRIITVHQTRHATSQLAWERLRYAVASWLFRASGCTAITLMVGIGITAWPAMALAIGGPGSERAEWLKSGWLETEYRYVVIEQDVHDVLTEFGRNLSLPMDISSEVEGRVRGDIPSGSAGEFLDRVAAANGLAWYFDGAVVHVATRQEITQRTFGLRDIDSTRLMQSLGRRVGEPLSAQVVDDGSALQVVGPPAWIDNVAQRIDRLRQPTPTGYAGVTVFRGSVATKAQTAE